jgi:hypothetical protein
MTTPHPSTTPSTGGIVALVIGVLLAIGGLSLAASGGVLLATDAGLADADGFVTMPRAAGIETTGAAIVTERMQFEEFDDNWPFDEPLRLRATVDESDQPLFIGIARAEDVEQAFAAVSVARLMQFDGWGRQTLDARGGDAFDANPAAAIDWETYAVGSGEQQLTWEPRDGDWVGVLMNADGSEGIDADVQLGVDLPFMTALGWALLAIGILLSLVAAALIIWGARSGRHAAPAAALDVGTGTETGAAVATTTTAHPLVLTAAIDEPIGRGLWLIKWLLLLPHYIVLAVLWLAVAVVTVVAWFAIVFTGRYPRSLHAFTVGVLRWSWRVSVYGYGALSTDRYPPFTLAPVPGYPAELRLERPEHLSRWLPLVKWVLVLPHLLIIAAISGSTTVAANGEAYAQAGLLGVLALIAGGSLLFRDALPRGVFDLMIGIQRWSWRVFAYAALLTDEYPPFRLDQGGDEPPAG